MAIGWNTNPSTTVFAGTLEIESGVAATLWTYSLAEGEVLGGRLTLTAGAVVAGPTTQRSRGVIEFCASRSEGGSAAATTVDMVESGTVPSGALSTAVDGNDVLVQITYTANVTLTYVVELTTTSLTPV